MLVALGWSALLAILAGGAWLLLRYSSRLGILAAVATGLALRLATMIVTHIVSLLNGNDGFLYIDDQGYLAHAETIATSWSSPDPQPFFTPVGILVHGGPLFYDLAAGVWWLTDGHQTQLGVKLVNVLLASTMILSTWIVARALAGPRVAKLAAWLVAIMPTLVWWSMPMMKEALSGALFVGGLAAATKLPKPGAFALTTVLMTALALSRVTLALAAGAGIVAWLGLRTILEWRTRAVQLAATTLAACAGMAVLVVMVVGGGSEEGIESRARQTVEQGRVEAKTPIEDGKAVRRKEKKRERDAERRDVTADAAIEEPGLEDDSFDSPVGSELAKAPLTEAVASGTRFLISPRAWAFATQPFDWHQPLYPAMWLWYVLFPAALLGLWRLRKRPDLVLVLLASLGTLGLYSATLSSGVRQRTAVEPLLIILIAAGIAAYGWRVAVRAGALVVALIAPLAAIDLEQPLVALPILLGAGVLWTLSARLPDAAGSAPAASDA